MGEFHLLISFLVFISIGAEAQEFGEWSNNDFSAYNCSIANIIRGEWYSREKNEDKYNNIDATTMSHRGKCKAYRSNYGAEYQYIFAEQEYDDSSCHHCVHFYVRTVNIIEKKESGCIQLPPNQRNWENICDRISQDQQISTLFSQSYTPINCRSSIEGVFQFTYQFRFTATGICTHPEQKIHSCQNIGSQFLISNQKFNMTLKHCEGMENTKDAVVEFSCLGDWVVGKNQYFAVANTKESRIDEKFRCFMKNRDDDYFLGQSITPECNQIKTVEQAPIRIQMTPVRPLTVEPGCLLPENFTGEWINTANIDANVIINSTHIIEKWNPDVGRWRKVIYICVEQRDTRYLMARLAVDGCQVDYQCIDFVPRHHNIIRFRRGVVFAKNEFNTVCSWVQFPNDAAWRYDIMIKKDPVPVRCPVAGAFEFVQEGDYLFKTRVIKGITKNPRPDVWGGRTGQFSCRKNISRLAVCDTGQKEITIDENYCWSVNHHGRPIDIYSEADYRMQCVGYWKENLKSYLITYDQLDAFTKYRCWVYQRADLNKMMMSMSVGPFCSLYQEVDSKDWQAGAVVAMKMQENEREFDRCPMYFNDGEDPWTQEENYIKVFDFSEWSSAVAPSLIKTLLVVSCLTLFMM